MYRDSEIGVVFHHGVLSRSRSALRVAQLVNVLFSLVYGVLVTRFLFEYVRAAPSPFVMWIAKVTNPAYLFARQLFANGKDAAGHPIAWALLILIVACAVVQWSVVTFLREIGRPRLED